MIKAINPEITLPALNVKPKNLKVGTEDGSPTENHLFSQANIVPTLINLIKQSLDQNALVVNVSCYFAFEIHKKSYHRFNKNTK